jgi:integrase
MTAARAALTALEGPGAGGVARRNLHGFLEELVRPEFRPLLLFTEPGDDVLSHPVCKVPSCGRPGPMTELCGAHRSRWSQAGYPPVDEWATTQAPGIRGRSPLRSCAVNGCGRGRTAAGLCGRHRGHWVGAGRPDLESWLPHAPAPRNEGLSGCSVDGCELLCESPRPRLCRGHGERWRNAGRPPIREFSDRCTSIGQHCFDFRNMPLGLARELQYGLQCRSDQRTSKATPRELRPLLRYLSETKPRSLLDEPADALLARMPPSGKRTALGGFVRFTISALDDLLEGVGWDSEYPRDRWLLRRLGLKTDNTATINFADIPQPWLRKLAKRWCRHQLVTGLAPATVARHARAITSLGVYVETHPHPAGPTGVRALDRLVLEGWLASIPPTLGLRSRLLFIGAVASFLAGIRQHQWSPGLPADAIIAGSDYPRRPELRARALSEYVMTQLESPANLELITDPRMRLATELIMRTGLRLGDALALPVDCLQSDAQGGAYLRYVNHKMNREAVVPVDDELAATIAAQQQAVRGQWPDGPVLFPRRLANPDGRHPVTAAAYYDHLKKWLAACRVHDEQGQPVWFTPHQWRHTYATRLINQEVPLEVVRRLLDHSSHQMTSHYARLHDSTVRQHWERARKVNHRGEVLTAVGEDSPLADAAWMKQNLSRATMTLPNGFCGLPLQKKCPHANACLDCPVFVTTADFLPQHRQQLATTRRLIATAEADGHFRMVEMNQRVADNLQAVIATLERAEEIADES